MDKNTKELLYKALGLALVVKDEFSKEFDEVIKEAKLSKEEIKKATHEAKDRAKEQKETFEQTLKEKVKSIVNELGLATKKDIQELKDLIKQKKL